MCPDYPRRALFCFGFEGSNPSLKILQPRPVVACSKSTGEQDQHANGVTPRFGSDPQPRPGASANHEQSHEARENENEGCWQRYGSH
jgi:hypothetical protein